jgi:hypothetical protein
VATQKEEEEKEEAESPPDFELLLAAKTRGGRGLETLADPSETRAACFFTTNPPPCNHLKTDTTVKSTHTTRRTNRNSTQLVQLPLLKTAELHKIRE